MSFRFRAVVGLFAAVALAGCVGIPASQQRLATAETLQIGLAAIWTVSQRPIRHVLALSSGGADGAFGAGVLAGWSESGTRPSFDVVTGVSTGALQAPLAFLGRDYDGPLQAVFTTTQTDDVFDGNGLGVLVKPGLSDAGPLRLLLTRIVTADMLAAIAAEHRNGRRLYVATTDLTRGRTAIWDMGAMAASGRADTREAFIAVLVASASPPGFVEPAPLIDGAGVTTLHGDGGVKSPILAEPAMLRKDATLWVIANGHVSRETPNSLERANAPALARRGVSQLLRSLLHGAVERADLLARRKGMAFRLQRLPDSVAEAKNPFVFDPVEMRGLFEEGLARGRDPRTWSSGLEVRAP